MLRVLVLDDQFVARPGEHAGPGALVDDADRPAARRIRGDQVPAVLDRAGLAADLVPLRNGPLPFAENHPVGAVAQGGHAASQEGERHLGQRPVLPPPDALGQGWYRLPGVVAELDPASAVLR